jgi:ABC-type branched-subunit amino acid transport system ATPase component
LAGRREDSLTALRCEQLECVFGGVRALDGVSFAVGPDELVGVMGNNAAGKTTLLNAICGLVQLRSGSVRLHGRDLSRLSERNRARAGIVRSFEDGGICDRLSTVDNVAIGLRRGWLRDRRKRADQWLERVHLAEMRSVEGGALSVGQRRRLELGRVLARAEEYNGRCVVLLDEPFRGLDDSGRRGLLQLLRDYCVGKVAVVMVEHNREMVKQLGARSLWMESGRVVEAPGSMDAVPPLGASQSSLDVGRTILMLKNVRAGYGSVEVLHGVDFDVREGDRVRLTGGNGAGKSTLLRVIMGTLHPTQGEVEVFGKRLPDAPSRPFHGVGYAPQGGRLVPRLTVNEHLELSRGVAAHRRAVPDLGPAFLDAFPELRPLLARRAGDLSSGQRSLVAVATAFASEPRLLIADEPASGLSPGLSERLYQFLRDRWDAPDRATIIVEHKPCEYPARDVRLVRGEIV